MAARADDNATPRSIVHEHNTTANGSCRKTGRASPSSEKTDTTMANSPADCAAKWEAQMSPPAQADKAATFQTSKKNEKENARASLCSSCLLQKASCRLIMSGRKRALNRGALFAGADECSLPFRCFASHFDRDFRAPRRSSPKIVRNFINKTLFNFLS